MLLKVWDPVDYLLEYILEVCTPLQWGSNLTYQMFVLIERSNCAVSSRFGHRAHYHLETGENTAIQMLLKLIFIVSDRL